MSNLIYKPEVYACEICGDRDAGLYRVIKMSGVVAGQMVEIDGLWYCSRCQSIHPHAAILGAFILAKTGRPLDALWNLPKIDLFRVNLTAKSRVRFRGVAIGEQCSDTLVKCSSCRRRHVGHVRSIHLIDTSNQWFSVCGVGICDQCAALDSHIAITAAYYAAKHDRLMPGLTELLSSSRSAAAIPLEDRRIVVPIGRMVPNA